MIDRPGEGEGFAASANELQALYREAGGDLPTPESDQRIIAAAHADLRAGARHSAYRANWLKRWLPATSAIAVALLGVSMAWRVVDHEVRELPDEPALHEHGNAAAPGPESEWTTHAVPALPVTSESRRSTAEAARPAAGKPSAKANVADTLKRAPATLTPPPAPPTTTRGLVRHDKSEAEQPLAESMGARLTPRAAASALPNSQGKSADILQPSSQPDSLPNSQPDSRPDSRPGSPPGALHERAAEPTDMQAWIGKIRALRAAGRDLEADESLARFRERYPAFVLPGDLAGVR